MAYFYCDGNYQNKQKPRFILGSLFRQLLEQSLPVLDSNKRMTVKRFYENNKYRTFQTRDSLEYFVIHLCSISTVFETVFIVIDGLDECHPREDFLEILSHLPNTRFRVLVTSRPEVDIKRAFSEKPETSMDEKAVLADITSHIDSRLEYGPRLKSLSPGVRAAIKEKLLRKCEGM